jgi:predicted O-linked N-acetylglucosamine transferase (SPINDLY family)
MRLPAILHGYVHYARSPKTSHINDSYSHDKIRLGYFSSDFYNHATAYLMAELLEQHDRSKFEVIGFHLAHHKTITCDKE